MQCKC